MARIERHATWQVHATRAAVEAELVAWADKEGLETAQTDTGLSMAGGSRRRTRFEGTGGVPWSAIPRHCRVEVADLDEGVDVRVTLEESLGFMLWMDQRTRDRYEEGFTAMITALGGRLDALSAGTSPPRVGSADANLEAGSLHRRLLTALGEEPVVIAGGWLSDTGLLSTLGSLTWNVVAFGSAAQAGTAMPASSSEKYGSAGVPQLPSRGTLVVTASRVAIVEEGPPVYVLVNWPRSECTAELASAQLTVRRPLRGRRVQVLAKGEGREGLAAVADLLPGRRPPPSGTAQSPALGGLLAGVPGATDLGAQAAQLATELEPGEQAEAAFATSSWTKKLIAVTDRRLLVVGGDADEVLAVPWSAVRATAVEAARVTLMLDDGPLGLDDVHPSKRVAELLASIESRAATPATPAPP